MKKFKKALSMLLVVASLMSLISCGNNGSTSTSASSGSAASSSAAQTGEPSPEDYNWPKFTTFLGASAGGNGILTISALAQVLTDNLPTTVSAQVTPGSAQNLYLMEQGDGNYAWGNAFGVYTATNGLLTYKDDPVEDEMGCILMYSNSTMQIAVRKGSGITCAEDLRGKKVVVGAAGGGTETNVRNIMQALGLYTEEGGYEFQAEYSGVSEGSDLISNGQADAIICGGAIPFSSYTELFLTDKIELIGFTDEEVKKVEAAEIGLTFNNIPAGSYDGKVTEDLGAVGLWSGLICKADCPEEEVYWITRTICENWDTLGTYHDLFAQLSAEDAAKAAISPYADIHPGALRYYQEMGWM